MSNIVFIATSLDGYIADKNGGLDWLNTVPNPENKDLGYTDLLNRIDAIVMGRVTFETVLGFGIPWPYEKPVFVLSNTLDKVPHDLIGKVETINGPPDVVINNLKQSGYKNLYIDGGQTISAFLGQGLIDELIITTIPVILGGGTRLFSEIPDKIILKLVGSKTYLDNIIQNHYKII